MKKDKLIQDMEWMLKANVAEIMEKAITENWQQETLDRWLRIKEVQATEQAATALQDILGVLEAGRVGL